ncbi:MAG: hypothetical protein AAGK23_09490 [Pseudomonadota bacterium]
MPKVTLEIVGIYYREEIEFEGESVNVLELMEIARNNGTGLDYNLDAERRLGEGRSMASISNRFDKGKVSRGGKFRNPGVYCIEETKREAGDYVVAWQYYILDKKNKRISATKPGDGFKTPELSEPVKDGYKVIWRCVQIALLPTIPLGPFTSDTPIA